MNESHMAEKCLESVLTGVPIVGEQRGVKDIFIFVLYEEMCDMSIVEGVFMCNCLSALVCFIHILIEYVQETKQSISLHRSALKLLPIGLGKSEAA